MISAIFAALWAQFIIYKHSGKIIIAAAALAAVGSLMLFGYLMHSCGKSEPKPDLQEINRINTENEQRINRERLESEAQTANVLKETDTKIRDAEKTPTRRTGNITGAELDKLAREQE